MICLSTKDSPLITIWINSPNGDQKTLSSAFHLEGRWRAVDNLIQHNGFNLTKETKT